MMDTAVFIDDGHFSLVIDTILRWRTYLLMMVTLNNGESHELFMDYIVDDGS